MTIDIDARLAEIRATGLTVVEGVLDDREIERARSMLDGLYAAFDPAVDKPMIDVSRGAAGAEEARRSTEFNWASVLVGKDPWFRGLMRRSPVFGIVAGILGTDCILSAMNSLEPLRDRGHQALHRDEGPVGPDGPVVVNSLWAIDDIAPANGTTRFVPGTHGSAELVGDDDPRLLRIAARAGSVVVFDAHVLHAASRNISGARRRAIHCYYTRAGLPSQTDWARYLSPATLAGFSAQDRRMLGL